MTITLTGLTGSMTRERFDIDRPGRYLIGRAHECDLNIPSDGEFANVSRRHCLLEVTRRSARLCDLNSSNGTYVNGLGLSEHAPDERWRELKNGDEIRIGSLYLRVTIDNSTELVGSVPLSEMC